MKHWMKREIEHSGEVRMPEPSWQQQASRRLVRPFFAGSRGQGWPVPFSEEGHLLRHTLGQLLGGRPADAPRPFSSCSPAAPGKMESPVGRPCPNWLVGGDLLLEVKKPLLAPSARLCSRGGWPTKCKPSPATSRDRTNSEDHQSSIPLLKNKDTALWVSPCQAAS